MHTSKPAEDWPSYLRVFRATHALTQASLAAALGIPKRTLENWEGGLRAPPSYLKLALKEIAAAKTPAG